MELIPRLLGMTSAVLLLFGVMQDKPVRQEPTAAKVVVAEVKRGLTSVATTQVPATVAPASAQCGQWWGLAYQAGWQEEQMQTLDYIMWRESRCEPHQHNTTLNKDGSTDMGLTQINDRSWCLPTKWYPDGYLQTQGVLISIGCEQLFDPLTNLRAAKEIYDYSKETNGNGFQPWGL